MPNTYEFLGKTVYFINQKNGLYYIDSMKVYAVSANELFDSHMRTISFDSIFEAMDEASESLNELIDMSKIMHQITLEEVQHQ